jgi:hypothetical protein
MTRMRQNPAGIRPVPYRKATSSHLPRLRPGIRSVREQQYSLLSAWEGDEAGTEELRATLRQYRTFWNRLQDFSRET